MAREEDRPVDVCRGCRETRRLVDVKNRLCRACYMANYRNAKDNAELFIDWEKLSENRRKRIEKATPKSRLIIIRWISEVPLLEKSEDIAAVSLTRLPSPS